MLLSSNGFVPLDVQETFCPTWTHLVIWSTGAYVGRGIGLRVGEGSGSGVMGLRGCSGVGLSVVDVLGSGVLGLGISKGVGLSVCSIRGAVGAVVDYFVGKGVGGRVGVFVDVFVGK